MKSTTGSTNSTQGFAAAEGGLNIRADRVRSLFVGYQKPNGTGPTSANPCQGTNMGTLDMACQTVQIGDRQVTTYVQDTTVYDASGNPEKGTVSVGETYAGLSFTQYTYTVTSVAKNAAGQTEAQLQMKFQSRLVPLFQFAAFYERDLEFHPGPNMTLNGPVHTNGSLYFNANANLTLGGPATAALDVYRAGKDKRPCTGTVAVASTTVQCNGFNPLTPTMLAAFGGSLRAKQPKLDVPTMGSLAPQIGNQTWDRADIRIIVDVRSPNTPANPAFRVVNANKTVNTAATNALNNSSNPVMSTSSWQDGREGRLYRLYNVNQGRLFAAIATGAFKNPDGGTLTVNDQTDGGMVWHLSVEDGDPENNSVPVVPPGGDPPVVPKPYAFRLAGAANEAADLGPTSGTQPQGLTIVSNQPIYTWGNFNSVNKIPASILADAINVLSGSAPLNQTTLTSFGLPVTTGTVGATVNAAFLAGVDNTNPSNPPTAGCSSSTLPTGFNGSLPNYTRFHENWGTNASNRKTMVYNGSFVSLGISRHTNGPFCAADAYYRPPTREWAFDTSFNDAGGLPPLSPRFVYLRQINFTRSY